MINYLNNNLILINEYQNLYKNGIDIRLLINKFNKNKLLNYNVFDYWRFRIFIDSCMLLLNREKYQSYNKISYKDFLKKLKNDEKFNKYFKGILLEQENPKVYISLEHDNNKLTPYDQITRIRNAMAHMQYGNFVSAKDGKIPYYYIYNKDKGVRKDSGIVFEPILHELIQSLFSNYSYGILFKFSTFSKYNFIKNEKSTFYDYYEFTIKKEYLTEYNGYNNNLVSELAKKSQNEEEFIDYVLKNNNKFSIERKEGLNYICDKKYIEFRRKYNLNSGSEYYYNLKTLLDFNTEISNFLVHIEQLNEVLYQYSIMNSNNSLSDYEKGNYKKNLENKILELKEDENAKIAFEIGFEYLKMMNFALRTEDDDYTKLKYDKIDVSKFLYDENAFQEYVIKKDNKALIQNYIIDRIRNGLMHGEIDISLSDDGDIIFIFKDIYNKREEKIKIYFKDLKKFLCQKSLYENIPEDTSYFILNSTKN